MEEKHQKQWRDLQVRARRSFDDPTILLGDQVRAGWSKYAQIWMYPSFEPHQSWMILSSHESDAYLVAAMHWNQRKIGRELSNPISALRLLGKPDLNPDIKIKLWELPRQQIDGIIIEMIRVMDSAPLESSTINIDGTEYGVWIKTPGSYQTRTWRSEGTEPWVALAQLHSLIIEAIH